MRRALAWVWRRLMLRTTVVAITGSVGKTTAKECLAAILSAHGRTLKTLHNRNDDFGVPRTLLRMRPWHRFAVIEVGTAGPGTIERSARLVRPDVAIVLGVARTHTNVFRTLDETAAEKARLLAWLPRRGTAILNGDDDHVRKMAGGCRARVVFFGRREGSDVVAGNVRSAWPERLHFTARAGGDAIPVDTQLVGSHWVGSVLASLAGARACGVPLEAAARALRGVPPTAGRMQPVALPGGAVLIRDEENGSPDTLEAMLAVLRDSRARRRVLVFGDQSDSRAKPRRRLRDMGALAAELTDLAVFVGEHSRHAVAGAVAAGMDPGRCHAVVGLEHAARLLKTLLREGDLAFLKGRGTDHLERILFAQLGSVGCWRSSCRIRSLCDLCPRLAPGSDLARVLSEAVARASSPSHEAIDASLVDRTFADRS